MMAEIAVFVIYNFDMHLFPALLSDVSHITCLVLSKIVQLFSVTFICLIYLNA